MRVIEDMTQFWIFIVDMYPGKFTTSFGGTMKISNKRIRIEDENGKSATIKGRNLQKIWDKFNKGRPFTFAGGDGIGTKHSIVGAEKTPGVMNTNDNIPIATMEGDFDHEIYVQ